MKHRRKPSIASIFYIINCLLQVQTNAWSTPNTSTGSSSASNDRRQFLSQITTVAGVTSIAPFANIPYANAEQLPSDQKQQQQQQENQIFTAGYGREEYTNSITASRDTNISPKEVYDSIQSSYIRYPIEQLQKRNDNRIPRAFDVGAGAGVSTQTLYLMGYKSIEAVDWSSKAWDDNVDEESVPAGVNFHPVDDERFLDERRKKDGGVGLFDVIVFNFAVNDSKAKSYAKSMLQPDGRLLAPVNTRSDYWMKQTFKVYDCQGNVLWTANDIGAWSVQFQPDVTQDTCQGIWCAPYNGFQKKR
jgi:2-polyprenyl-3-methyl-5-hydroxy-6-metoxy-1,4-benzoquinol methylase